MYVGFFEKNVMYLCWQNWANFRGNEDKNENMLLCTLKFTYSAGGVFIASARGTETRVRMPLGCKFFYGEIYSNALVSIYSMCIVCVIYNENNYKGIVPKIIFLNKFIYKAIYDAILHIHTTMYNTQLYTQSDFVSRIIHFMLCFALSFQHNK
jgi:hypothetical protein